MAKADDGDASHVDLEQTVHDEAARGLVEVACGAWEADAHDVRGLPPDDVPAPQLEVGAPRKEHLGLHPQEHPQAQGGRKGKAKGLEVQHLHEEEVEDDVGDDVARARKQRAAAPVLDGEERREGVAEHQRDESYGLAKEVDVEQRA